MWSAVRYPGQKTYYVNHETNETTWDKPIELYTARDHALAQTPWKEYETDAGKAYWYNEHTKESTWEYPLQIQENLTPEKEFERVCKTQGLLGGSFVAALPQLMKHKFYWEMDQKDRIKLFESLQKEYSGEVETEARNLFNSKLAQLKQQMARGYVSAGSALALMGSKKAVLEAFEGFKPLELPEVTVNVTVDEDWGAIEAALPCHDPRIITKYREVLSAKHNKTMEKLKKDKEEIELKAAASRLQFLEKLYSIPGFERYRWLEIVDQLEKEIIDLARYPGSTPIDLFFWAKAEKGETEQRAASVRGGVERLKEVALAKLKHANKKVQMLSFQEFVEVTGVDNHETYSSLQSFYFEKERSKLRERAQRVDEDAPQRKEVALDY